MVKTGKPSGAASDFYDSLEPVKLIRAASKEGKRQESPRAPQWKLLLEAVQYIKSSSILGGRWGF